MDTNQLLGAMQAFISVVESGSFSASARRLGLSQPTVSRQINGLEEKLGVRLLQRTTRRLSLTEAGEVYYQQACRIQSQVLEANLSISGFTEKPSGVLRIAAPHVWAEELIAPHMGEFLQRYPEIVLDVECNDAFQDMVADRLDLVMRVGVVKDSRFVAVPIVDVRMLVVASPEYVRHYGEPSNIEQLTSRNFIQFEDFNRVNITLGQQQQMVNFNGNVKLNSVALMLAAVKQGLGVSVLPDLLVKPLLASGEVMEILNGAKVEVVNLPINQVFVLYSSRKHLSAKARAFVDFYRERLQSSAAGG